MRLHFLGEIKALHTRIDSVEKEIVSLRTEAKTEIASLRTEMVVKVYRSK
jgi:hypothetical protein